MDEDHEFSDAELEDSGSAGRSSNDGSHSGSDPVSSDESSEDSNDELSGSATLAPYSFEPSDSDSASALPDDGDGDDARDERLSDTSW